MLIYKKNGIKPCWVVPHCVNSHTIDSGIKNERRDYKIGMVCGKGDWGDEGEGTGMMGFIHTQEIER
jgi:hypothetical protein